MIPIQIQSQPDDESCGPTTLQAVYRYYGVHLALSDMIQSIQRSLSGGTLAAYLGNHALQRQFTAVMYVNTLNVFDPTWFKASQNSSSFLISKLEQQLEFKKDPGIVQESLAYIDFLRLGGELRFSTITASLLKRYFEKSIPIITGLSATYLYRNAREYYIDGKCYHDDVQGTPCGHFVILCGYDATHRRIMVADPHEQNPLSSDHYYRVGISRLLNAIMLGVLTYDANLLMIQPKTT